MSVEVISTDRFKNEIFDFTKEKEFNFNGNTPIVLNFFATWCGPCRSFAPHSEKISKEYSSTIKVYKIDIDAHPEVPALFGIRSIPTTVFFTPKEEPSLSLGNLGETGLRTTIIELFGVCAYPNSSNGQG